MTHATRRATRPTPWGATRRRALVTVAVVLARGAVGCSHTYDGSASFYEHHPEYQHEPEYMHPDPDGGSPNDKPW